MYNQYPSSTTSSSRSSSSRRKWFIDLQVRKHDRVAANVMLTSAGSDNPATATAVVATSTNTQLSAPMGYGEQRVPDVVTHEDNDHLIARRSWEIALQPIKQLPMNLIFAWMAGNSFSLMSIMIVVMLFMKPIQSIFSLGSAFASLTQEGVAGNVWLLKLTYLLGNLVHLALALYKCQSMGLLPTYNSDWIAFADEQTQLEITAGGFSYS